MATLRKPAHRSAPVETSPCPFCGRQFMQLWCTTFATGGVQARVDCLDCGARGPYADAIDKAWERWNRREEQR